MKTILYNYEGYIKISELKKDMIQNIYKSNYDDNLVIRFKDCYNQSYKVFKNNEHYIIECCSNSICNKFDNLYQLKKYIYYYGVKQK